MIHDKNLRSKISCQTPFKYRGSPSLYEMRGGKSILSLYTSEKSHESLSLKRTVFYLLILFLKMNSLGWYYI
jgi:hypothetical protein